MKFLTSAIVASTAASFATAENFTSVDLEPPLDWVVGSYLWPTEIIAGYNALVDDTDWTDATWDAYVLAECETYTACTSSISWQGTNSGSDGGSRYWYGYVFRGGPTNESFYVRDTDEASNVTLSSAWTIVE
ncbi:hypothetical protein M406DRAFT_246138 [Cryphonectria parasitica EP155]|uniref:Uncharacterized protein n=1 Tax=Cryphonectria parasitica (strain ATCC 38755 / EP155) TaxID=660469 RepID=A0A9P5CVY8_CRYP1|nr:uncharacterized protein M406DRAFT_246138 [Cryphonectria parasitica EP155]KAF3771366.1 hypothetical protein M406DRAFT_246138 [Cryphonectria parasitica EP155]